MTEPTYRSEARRAALPRWEREHQDNFGRASNGRFVPRFAEGGRCDREECPEKVEAPGRRFCAIHRREHGEMLLAQLRAMTGAPK